VIYVGYTVTSETVQRAYRILVRKFFGYLLLGEAAKNMGEEH